MARTLIRSILLALIVIASPVILAAQPPAPMPAPAAQAAAPGPVQPGSILAVWRSDIKPGRDAAVEKVEHALARIAADKMPGMPRSLAMTTVAGPAEAWFLFPMPSFAALDTVMENFPKLPAPLLAEWARLNEQEGGYLNAASMVLYRYLPEYSRGATTDVSPYRYMQAVTYRVRPGREGEFMDLSRTFQDALKKVRPDSVWAMFELVAGADEGTYLVMLPMKNLAGLADDPALKKALMAALGPDGAQKFQKTAAEVLVSSTVTLFAFNPAMSSVAPIFAKADPWWAWKAAAAAKTETAPSKPADMTKPAAVPVKK